MLIVFSGMAGSGKSTFTKKTVEFLKKKGVNAEQFHFLEFSSFFILHRLITPTQQKAKGVLKKVKYDKKIKFYLFAALRNFLFFIDIFRFYFFKWFSIRKKVFVFERYFYDNLIHLVYKGMTNNFLFNILLRLVPKPDVLIALDVKPRIAHKRRSRIKENYPLSYFITKYKLYKNLFAFLKNRTRMYHIKNIDFKTTQRKIENIMEEVFQ